MSNWHFLFPCRIGYPPASGKFLNFYIPIPPYDEQKKIADYITDKVNHIEVEIDKRNKLIKKYQEYKKSLIYEVVTGKKEV